MIAKRPTMNVRCGCNIRIRRSTSACSGPDVGHYVFLPEATDTGKTLEPDLCRDPDGVDRRAIHRDAAAAVEVSVSFRR